MFPVHITTNEVGIALLAAAGLAAVLAYTAYELYSAHTDRDIDPGDLDG